MVRCLEIDGAFWKRCEIWFSTEANFDLWEEKMSHQTIFLFRCFRSFARISEFDTDLVFKTSSECSMACLNFAILSICFPGCTQEIQDQHMSPVMCGLSFFEKGTTWSECTLNIHWQSRTLLNVMGAVSWDRFGRPQTWYVLPKRLVGGTTKWVYWRGIHRRYYGSCPPTLSSLDIAIGHRPIRIFN